SAWGSTGGTCAARAAACTLVELSEIADQLLKKGQFASGRRRRSGYRSNLFPVLQTSVVDGFDNALIVKADDVDLLIKHVGVEEGELPSPPADIVPRFFVEDADA